MSPSVLFYFVKELWVRSYIIKLEVNYKIKINVLNVEYWYVTAAVKQSMFK